MNNPGQRDVIHLRPEIAKNKDGRVIVMVGEIANIIARKQEERVESCPYVFHREGDQIGISTGFGGWHEKKAGLPGQTAKQITGQ